MEKTENRMIIERRIAFSQTDAAGLIHFTTYFTLMEEAEATAQIMSKQMQLLEADYDRRDIGIEEGNRLLSKLQEINDSLNQTEDILGLD